MTTTITMTRPSTRSLVPHLVSLAGWALLATLGAPSGRAWAGDTTADRVLGQVAFAYGTQNLVDDRGMALPRGVAIDRSSVPNRVYVADTGNSRVLAWADVTAFASGAPADLVIGQPDAFTAGCNSGGVSATSLCSPTGVAVDAAGNLYVADFNNNRVLEYDTPFSSGVAADRVFGQGGSFTTATCNPGGTSATSLCFPRGVAVDATGNLYVADESNSRVLEYDTPLASGVAADRVFGQGGSFTTATCNLGGTSATSLCIPRGVAVDAAGNLYIADNLNSRVLEYDTPLASGVAADRVFGQGGSFTTATCNLGGTSATSLCSPFGVAVDAAGNLYVADPNNSRVLEYDTPLASGVAADRVFGQGGSFTSATCNLGGTSATSLCSPFGVAVDAAGNLYVADPNNSRVLEYDTPLASGVAADRVLGQVTFVRNGQNLVDARGVDSPQAVAIDRSVVPNRVYVADAVNSRVLAWADVTAFADGEPADRVIGQPDFFSFGCNTGGVSATSLCDPTGVAVDAAGNVYVVDRQNHRVLEYDTPFTTNGTADRVFGQGGSLGAGTCNLGGVSATSLCNPQGVTVDAAGNLYIADRDNHRVLEYDTPLVSGVAADRVFGQGGSFASGTCNLGGVSATSFCLPVGVAVDAAGNLYVADAANRRVLEYDTPLASDVTADRVIGQGGSFASGTCNLGGVSPTSLCNAEGVAVDAAGNVYVADSNSRVLEYDTPLTTDVTADRVFGQLGSFTSAGCNPGGVSAASLCNPFGLALDAAGNLYVADRSNHRVLEYDTPVAVCGNGVPELGEACDDGNLVGGDCCSATCTYETAGSACAGDGNPCTDDQCDGAGACGHPSNTAPCDDGLFCNGTDACSAGACAHAGDPCTGGSECADTCNEAADNCFEAPGTSCVTDGNPCTDDQCDGAGACAHASNTAPCDDGLFCTGADTCSGGACTHAGDPCTGGAACADTCNEGADDCLSPAATPCADDADPCTLDQCDGGGTCAHPAGNDGAPCSDGDDCTTGETCGGGACTGGTGVTCPLCETCNPTGGCTIGPRTGCKVPTQSTKAQLLLKDASTETGDQVTFKWTKGQATTFPDLGNPLTTDDYALCVFDATNARLLQMTAPAGGTCGTKPCWKQLGSTTAPKGYKYKDADGLPDDLDGITLKAGLAGAAKLTLKGTGGNIPLPPLGALALPLRAQLQSENGQCYEGTFSTPMVNTTAQFKAKSD